MSEGRSLCGGSSRDIVAIDTNRILDSCRDKDCYEDVKVYLGSTGQDIIEHTGNVRVKYAEIVSANVSVEPVQFSRGFYTVNVRFYVKIVLEGCIYPGKAQEFCGLSVIDKKVILFGSEGNVNIYKSSEKCSFCSDKPFGCSHETNLPVDSGHLHAPGKTTAVTVAALLKMCRRLCHLILTATSQTVRMTDTLLFPLVFSLLSGSKDLLSI